MLFKNRDYMLFVNFVIHDDGGVELLSYSTKPTTNFTLLFDNIEKNQYFCIKTMFKESVPLSVRAEIEENIKLFIDAAVDLLSGIPKEELKKQIMLNK